MLNLNPRSYHRLHPMMLLLIVCTAVACTKSTDEGALEKARNEAISKQAQSDKSKSDAAKKASVGAKNVNSQGGAAESTTRLGSSVKMAESGSTDTSAAIPKADFSFTVLSKITEDPELLSALKKLEQTGKEKSMRKEFERLQKSGKPAEKVLIAALKAKPPNVRTQAALILRRMEHRSAAFTEALNEMLLSDPDPDVRGIAGRVMVYYLERKTVPALIKALADDKTEAVRMHAAWALGAIKDKRSTTALIGALEDGSTDVRLRAVGALKRLRAKSAVPYLVSRLEDSNTLVRTRAKEALKKITGKILRYRVRPTDFDDDGDIDQDDKKKAERMEFQNWREAYPLPK